MKRRGADWIWASPLLAILSIAANMADVSMAASLSPRAVSSPGCGKTAPAKLGTMTQVNLTLSKQLGGDRHYFYWLPPTYDAAEPSPVIFSFHGGKSSAADQARIDYLTDPSAEFNTGSPSYVVVYPEATFEQGTRDRLWQVAPEMTAQGTDDVGYVLAILDSLRSALCLDDSRIYSTGMSQGGGMTNLLACNATTSNLFAAYAPVSGSYYYPYPGGAVGTCRPDKDKLPCAPGREDIPILAFHGGDDQVIAYEGGDRRGACTPDIPYWAEQWAQRNGLDVKSMQTFTVANATSGFQANVIEDLGGSAKRYSYGEGSGSSNNPDGLVQLVFDGKNVGHTWPATFVEIDEGDGEAVGSGPTRFNATSLILNFFARYTLPDYLLPSPSPTETTSPTSSPSPSPTGANSAPRSTLYDGIILCFSMLAIVLVFR